MQSDICAHCGRSKSEHHEFTPVIIPANCKCNPRDWRDQAIPYVCNTYKEDNFNPGLCKTCEHLKECHYGA